MFDLHAIAEKALFTFLVWLSHFLKILVMIHKDVPRYCYLSAKKFVKLSIFHINGHFCKNTFLLITHEVCLIFFQFQGGVCE